MHMREKGLFPLQAKRRMRLQKALRLLFILLAVQRTGGIDETAADAHLARGTLQDLLLQRDQRIHRFGRREFDSYKIEKHRKAA